MGLLIVAVIFGVGGTILGYIGGNGANKTDMLIDRLRRQLTNKESAKLQARIYRQRRVIRKLKALVPTTVNEEKKLESLKTKARMRMTQSPMAPRPNLPH